MSDASSKPIHARFFLQQRDFCLDIDLQLPSHGVTVFFGHSGSGKTTLLRCIAGLEKPTQGYLNFQGEIWQDQQFQLPTHRRPIGFVFQESSLFPHLTARGNLQFASRRADPSIRGVDFQQAVELLGINSLLDHYPAELSGGERQRVAIARALLIRPRLLLMDEPLASLDLARKQEILPYLENLKQELELPIFYVSHAPDEVARLTDHLVALDNGKVVATGSLEETLSRLDFPIQLGEDVGVVIEATVTERDSRWELAKVCFDGGELWFRDSGHTIGQSVRVRVFARDISLALQHHDDSSIVNSLPAVIIEIVPDNHPGMTLVRLMIGKTTMIARITQRSAHKLALLPGKSLWAQIKSVAIIQ